MRPGKRYLHSLRSTVAPCLSRSRRNITYSVFQNVHHHHGIRCILRTYAKENRNDRLTGFGRLIEVCLKNVYHRVNFLVNMKVIMINVWTFICHCVFQKSIKILGDTRETLNGMTERWLRPLTRGGLLINRKFYL